MQTVNESRVRKTPHFSGRFDADAPPSAKLSLTISAVAIGKATIANHGLFDRSEQILSAAVASLGFTKKSFVRSVASDAVANSHFERRSTSRRNQTRTRKGRTRNSSTANGRSA